MTLDELREQNTELRPHAFIDTTKGKVTEPVHGVAGDPTNSIESNFITPKPATLDDIVESQNHTPPERTPVSDTLPPPRTPSIKVVDVKMPSDPDKLEKFDINSLPKRPAKINPDDEARMSALDAAVEREKKSISERIDAITEMQYQEFLANHEDDATKEEEYDTVFVTADSAVNETVINHTTESDISFEDDYNSSDSFSEDDSSSEEITKLDLTNIDNDILAETGKEVEKINEDAMLEDLKREVKRNIIPIRKKIDLNAFSVADTPVAASKAVSFSIGDLNRADWVLPNSKCTISCSGLTGPEIFALNPENSSQNRSRLNQFKDIYSIIYRHIISKKPSFEEWMKNTRFSDIQHIYFALYKATFAGSNFLYYECPKCHKIFIQDHPFESMVKYANEATKQEIDDLLNSNRDPSPIVADRYQISDNYVVDITEPTIWSTMEFSSLSNEFLTKYENLIDVLTFVSNIYVIDETNMKLLPVDTNPDKSSIAKTIGRRISTFASIVRTLPSDNFIDLRGYITNKYNALNRDNISYQIPEQKCPKCDHTFKATPMEASTLLFTRHQLGAFGTI